MTFLAALILGLIASAHCTSMCSGLQNALQPDQTIRSQRVLFWHTLLMNAGRLTTYVLIGTAFTLSSLTLLNMANFNRVAANLRVASAVLIFLIGINMIFRNWRVFSALEPIGKWIWNSAQKLVPYHRHHGLVHSYTKGLVWGTLPCGLLYSVYLTAALSGSINQGASIMLGFGVGTLPAMLSSGVALIRLKQFLNTNQLQIAVGLLYCTGAVLMLVSPLLVDMTFMQTYPGLASTFFCLR